MFSPLYSHIFLPFFGSTNGIFVATNGIGVIIYLQSAEGMVSQQKIGAWFLRGKFVLEKNWVSVWDVG